MVVSVWYVQVKVCGIRCTKSGCVNMTAQDKRAKFDLFYSLTYNEQSALLMHQCINVHDKLRRKRGPTEATSRLTVGRITHPICVKTVRYFRRNTKTYPNDSDQIESR